MVSGDYRGVTDILFRFKNRTSMSRKFLEGVI